MSKSRIIFALAAVILFYIFYSWIEVGTYFSYGPIFLSIVGGFLISACLVPVLAKFHSFADVFGRDEDYPQEPKHTLVVFFGFFGSLLIAYILSCNYDLRKIQEFKNFGVRTNATVVDGLQKNSTSLKGRKSSESQITFEYTTREGQKLKWTESVNSDDFENAYKGQKIELIYSTLNPRMVELLINKETRKRYSSTVERKIQVDDFEKLYNIQNKDSVLIFLNSFNYGWKKMTENGDRSILYRHDESKDFLMINSDKQIVWVTKSFETGDKFKENIYKAGFVVDSSAVLPRSNGVIGKTLWKKDESYFVLENSLNNPFVEKNEDDIGLTAHSIFIYGKN
jgi:hypothetical protein